VTVTAHRYVYTRGQTYGPVDERHLVEWFREGRCGADDWVWVDEEERWVAARSLPSLRRFLPAVPPASGRSSFVGPPPDRPRGESAPATENLFAFEEARRFVRFRTQLPASWCPLLPGRPATIENYRPCTLLNISAGGAGVAAHDLVSLGTSIHLFVPRIDPDPEPFSLAAKVVRTAPATLPLLVEHGIRFADPETRMRLRLAHFIGRLVR
jgi:hypothetical protein